MVLETSWGTGSGWIIVRDALLIGGWHHEDERSGTHRRAPTDYDADHVLLRTIRCVNGQVEIVMDCEPVFDYGTKAVHWDYTGPGYNDGMATAPGSDVRLGLRTNLRIGFEGPRATARHRMKEASSSTARSTGQSTRRRRPSRRPTSVRSGPPITGSTGSTAARSRITHGARTCSAAR